MGPARFGDWRRVIERRQHSVWVIDTSAILQVRRMYDPTVPDTHHRRYRDKNYCAQVLHHMTQLVTDGHLAFPRQVRDELYKPTSNDLASQWVHHCAPLRRHHEPAPSTVRLLLSQIPNLIDYTKVMDDADPYVVAQAIEIQNTALFASVVTEDRRDRRSTSITTACRKLGIPCINTLQFLSDCGSPNEPT